MDSFGGVDAAAVLACGDREQTGFFVEADGGWFEAAAGGELTDGHEASRAALVLGWALDKLLDLKSTSTSSMVLVPRQSAGGKIMSKQQERSRREVGGAVFAVIFCVALALGLWWGTRRLPARTPQNQTAETSANQAVNSQTSFYCNTKSL